MPPRPVRSPKEAVPEPAGAIGAVGAASALLGERPDSKELVAEGESTHRTSIGLALSGGGARGFAHIGMLKVLERHGVEVDVLAGTSMGAILGALYAYGYRADDLHELATSISWRDVIDLSLAAGLLKGEKLHHLLSTYLPESFEELSKPLAVTTTDIESGEQVVFTHGDLITAVRASSCFPGAFEPIQLGVRTLADGGITNNLPVDALALMHAGITLASDVTPPRRSVYVHPSDEPSSWWERMVATVTLERRTPMAAVTLRASDIMMRLLSDVQYVLHPADLRVQHDMPSVRIEAFWELDQIVEAGVVSTEAALAARPDLLERMQQASIGPLPGRALPAAETPAKTTARGRGRVRTNAPAVIDKPRGVTDPAAQADIAGGNEATVAVQAGRPGRRQR